MSLSEKAAQLDALADASDVQSVMGALAQASQAAENAGQQAAAIIGDLPAGQEAYGVWQQVKQQIDETQNMAGAAAQRLKDIAAAVRAAGSA